MTMTNIATKALAETLNVSEPNRDTKNNTWFSFIQGKEPGRQQIVLSRKANITPFGLATYNERQTLTIALGQENDQDMREFFNVLDRKVREHMWSYRSQVFRNPPGTLEALAALQKPCIRPGKDGLQDTLQLKVDAYSSFYALPGRAAMEPSSVEKGCQIVCIAAPARVWCMSTGEFGVSLKVVHALVGERPKEDPEKLFEDCSFG